MIWIIVNESLKLIRKAIGGTNTAKVSIFRVTRFSNICFIKRIYKLLIRFDIVRIGLRIDYLVKIARVRYISTS